MGPQSVRFRGALTTGGPTRRNSALPTPLVGRGLVSVLVKLHRRGLAPLPRVERTCHGDVLKHVHCYCKAQGKATGQHAISMPERRKIRPERDALDLGTWTPAFTSALIRKTSTLGGGSRICANARSTPAPVLGRAEEGAHRTGAQDGQEMVLSPCTLAT